jgi:NitT/TauT family transport system ATP-binding protein
MYIEIKEACKNYVQDGKEFTALDHVSLDIEKGEFICLLGPSGCGKSTLLNALAGFEKVNSGSVKIDGKEVTAPSINNITIFQNYGLLPWRNVQKNVELGLESKKVPKSERAAAAKKYLELVGLSGYEKRYPKQLSGGQQQRVAIARSIAYHPDLILFDEPTSALDPELTREVLKIMIKLAKEGITMVVVTHEMDFARNVADRVIFMENGVVVEDAPSKVFFNHPQEEATKRFLRTVLTDYDFVI